MIKLGLIDCNGSSLVGGGSIQLEYDYWGQQKEDIELFHFLHTETEQEGFYPEYTINGRTFHNVYLYSTEKEPLADFFAMDKLIILSPPFKLENPFDIDENKAINDWYLKLFKEYKTKENFLGLVCYDYAKEVVLNNTFIENKHIIHLIDKFWINNKKNPLTTYLLNHFDLEEDKFYFECPQFMTDWKPETYSPKIKNRFYFQGRGLDWKGWKDLLYLKQEFDKVDENNFHYVFNGINLSDEEVEDVLVNGYPKFSNDINSELRNVEITDNEIHLFGRFNPKDIPEYTSSAQFGMYYTNLNPDNNFFPEYALIDFVRNGTIVILPDWYKDKNLYEDEVTNEDNIINSENSGFLFWHKDREEDTKKLFELIKGLQESPIVYKEYTDRAYKYMIDNFGADKKILPFIF